MEKVERLRILKRAKKLLSRKYGWTRGFWHMPVSKRYAKYDAMCINGALNVAAGHMRWYRSDSGFSLTLVYAPVHDSFISNAIGLEDYCMNTRGKQTMELNDYEGTKKEDVLQLLDDYIKVVEEHEYE